MFACNKSSHYHRQLCSISCKLGSSQSICSFPALNFVHLLCHFRCPKLLYISLKTGKRLQPHNVRSFFKRVVVSIWQKGAYKLLIFFLAGFCTNVRGKKSLAAEMRNCVSVKLKTISGPLIMLLFFLWISSFSISCFFCEQALPLFAFSGRREIYNGLEILNVKIGQSVWKWSDQKSVNIILFMIQIVLRAFFIFYFLFFYLKKFSNACVKISFQFSISMTSKIYYKK